MASNNRDMQWAIGTAVVFLLVVGIGGLIASGASATVPTPPAGAALAATPPGALTSTPVPSPSVSAKPTSSPTSSPTGTATPLASPTLVPPSPSPAATPSVRRMTSAELTLLLHAQVEAQRAQFRDGKVRFLPPDQVVITGSTAVGGQPAPVEAVLTVGIDGGGRPKVLAYRLTQGGRPAAPAAQAALAARVTQTNSELEQMVPRSQRVKRVWVTADAINGELTE